MSNAAVYIHPDAFDTTGARLMGRHSAGESFLRGLIRHGSSERLHFYNGADLPLAGLRSLVDRIEPSAKQQEWIGMRDLRAVSGPGCLYHPSPSLPELAWTRRPLGSDRYSLCGVTHTTATARVMDIIGEMAIAPIEDWDGLICTSRAVRASVEHEMTAVRTHLAERLGASRFPAPQLATIPLGVNAADFAPSPEQRRAWREKLGIPEDAVVALYVGRFNAAAKMNPAMMALTLENAAKQIGREIYWVVSGWGPTDKYTQFYHDQTRALCPSVRYLAVDGRPADTRFSIWSVADFFISFSDNIQETFGLTPAEAMAAGLPCVVTDWDGYRETVRHGVDGFRIRTYAPRPGLGRDIAFSHANGWSRYELYLATASQMTAMDSAGAVEAVVALATNPDLRLRMGAAAREAARTTFDWSVIIPQYEAFWSELAERRAAATAAKAGRAQLDNPYRLDPFSLFQAYPSELLSAETMVSAVPGVSWPEAETRLSGAFATAGRASLPSLVEAQTILAFLQARESASVAEIVAQFPPPRASFIERGLLWLVKFELLSLRARGAPIED